EVPSHEAVAALLIHADAPFRAGGTTGCANGRVASGGRPTGSAGGGQRARPLRHHASREGPFRKSGSFFRRHGESAGAGARNKSPRRRTLAVARSKAGDRAPPGPSRRPP